MKERAEGDSEESDQEEKDYVEEMIKRFRETKKIEFPNNRGVTGKAF